MIYADAEFYEQEFLRGRPPVIPLEQFEFYALLATNRINRKRVELEYIPKYLKICTCLIAEAIYTDEQNQKAGAKSSESVGSYSVSYLDQRKESPQLAAQISGIISDWLALTDLHNDFVFRGI